MERLTAETLHSQEISTQEQLVLVTFTDKSFCPSQDYDVHQPG